MRAMTWQLWVTLGAIGLVCLLWLVAAGALLWAVLDPSDFQTILTALNGRWGLLIFLWAISLVPIYSVLRWAANRYLAEPERLADAVDLHRKQHLKGAIPVKGIPAIDRLTDLFNDLLAQEREAFVDVEQRIAQALEQTEEERAWLSALLAELNRSVIVCNREGQILLYNNRARLQFKRLSDAGNVTHGGELLGLGRSIFDVVDRSLIEHARATIEHRLAKGQRQASSQCLFQTPRGRSYRVHVTPICRHVFAQSQKIDGMILVIENITEEVKVKQLTTQSLHHLAHETHNHSAMLEALAQAHGKETPEAWQASAATLLEYHQTWLDTVAERLMALPTKTLRPYPLEDLSVQDWIDAIEQALNATDPDGHGVSITAAPKLDDVWLRVDSMSSIRALIGLLGQLKEQQNAQGFQLKFWADEDDVVVRIGLTEPLVMDSDEVFESDHWLDDLLSAPSTESPLGQTIGEVFASHGGRWTIEPTHLELRLGRIPSIGALPEALAERHDSRPEYYDFRLFDVALTTQADQDQALDQISFTVFDTETTGLNPSGGDEIIQIGAVRIVNGRILSREVFDQLIDPRRPIPASSIAIHGIRPEDVDGQPTIETVLPLFHRFCANTVLVAHNADFDMQCLSMKSPRCGVEFNFPVLDTLLLSVLAHPYQDTHNLDDIAIRLGIDIHQRHHALGDAKMTAEILIRLLPILKDRGIHTLKDALEAQRSVWQKRAIY